MGSKLKEATEIAILNSNYIKDRLKPYYKIYKENKNGRVGHEFIIDLSEFKKYNINDYDVSKRLMDYNFHSPTVSWPVPNSLMIEPTESENFEELERFIKAMINIRYEINEIQDNLYSIDNNVLKNSPHTMLDISNWNYNYSIKKGCFPMKNLLEEKKWPSRNRINNIYGDKLLLNNNK